METTYQQPGILKRLVICGVKNAMKIKRLRHRLLGTLAIGNPTKEQIINYQKELLNIFLQKYKYIPYLKHMFDNEQGKRQPLKNALQRISHTELPDQKKRELINTLYQMYHELMPILRSSDMQGRMTLEKAIYYTRQKIIALAQTSGTTSGNTALTHKLIPISYQRIQQDIRAMGQLINVYLDTHPESSLFDGLALTMGGAMNKETNVGYISGVLGSEAGIVGNALKIPSMQTASISDREEKKKAIMQEIINNGKPITSIAGVMMRGIDLMKQFKETHGHELFIRYFGDLELVIIGGAPVGTVIEDIESLFEDCENNVLGYTYDHTKRSYINTYNASEGFFAFQTKPMKAKDTTKPEQKKKNTKVDKPIAPRDDSMQLLTNHGIVYHFIPVKAYKQYLYTLSAYQALTEDSTQKAQQYYSEMMNEYVQLLNNHGCAPAGFMWTSGGAPIMPLVPKMIGLDEVKKGTEYALFITNPASGLRNYEMGDVVSFTDIDTFQIKVMGRVHESSNVANEHMEIPHIEKAFATLNINPKTYTIGVKNNGVGQPYTYQFFVECKEDMTVSPKALQEALCEHNGNYKRMSQAGKFTLPEVYVLPEGSIKQYMSENKKIHAQTKIPRLRGDTNFTEGLGIWSKTEGLK